MGLSAELRKRRQSVPTVSQNSRIAAVGYHFGQHLVGVRDAHLWPRPPKTYFQTPLIPCQTVLKVYCHAAVIKQVLQDVFKNIFPGWEDICKYWGRIFSSVAKVINSRVA
jgi:hypothetical protein